MARRKKQPEQEPDANTQSLLAAQMDESGEDGVLADGPELDDPEIQRIRAEVEGLEDGLGGLEALEAIRDAGEGYLEGEGEDGEPLLMVSGEDEGDGGEDEDDGDGDGEDDEDRATRAGFRPSTRKVYTPEEIERRDRRAELHGRNPVKMPYGAGDGPAPPRGGRGGGTRTLPPPKVFHFESDRKIASAHPSKFWDYWRSLEGLEYARGRLICYIYRIYPVMKPDSRQVAKVVDWFPMSQLAKLYGAGDYHLKLNDAGMNYKSLAICTVKNVGDRNWNEHPPVLDPEGIEMDDPLNRPYISWARSRGIAFPGDAMFEANQRAKREMEDDMAEAQIKDRVVNKAFDILERGRRDDDDVPQSALARSIELISKAGEVQGKLMERGIDRVLEMQNQRNSGNPLKEAMELIHTFMPKGGQSDIQGIVQTILDMESKHSDKLFQIQLQQQQQRDQEIAHLRSQLEKLVERQANPQPAQTGVMKQPTSLKEQLQELKDMKDVIRDALGIEDEGGKGGGSSWAEHLPLILQAGTVLVGSMASILHNLAVVQGKGGTPIAPPPVDAALSPDQREAMASMGGAHPGHPGMGHPGPAAQPAHGAGQGTGQVNYTQQQENAMTRAHQFFGMITVPLLRSYNSGEDGAEFAARLVELTDSGFFGPETSGTQVYDQVLEFGQPLVNSLIKTYPPIWSVVGTTPAKWERFLTEFFNARAIWAVEGSGEDEDEGPAAPAAGTQGQQPPAPQPGPVIVE